MEIVQTKLNRFQAAVIALSRWAIVPTDLLASKNNRLAYVDFMRGWMICLVVIAHCFGQSAMQQDSWLWNLNPTGWATKVFVMLTGFSALVILRADRKENANRIYRRALQVALIALISNMLSVMLTKVSITAAIDSLLFRLPWTISQFLIPTALILAISPSVARLCHRFGSGHIVLVCVVVWFGSDWLAWYYGENLTGLAELALHGNAIISLPILHYVLAGMSVQALAAWLADCASEKDTQSLKLFSLSSFGIGTAVLIGDMYWNDWIGDIDHLLNAAVALSRFVVFLHLSLWICRAAEIGSDWALKLAGFIKPIGQSALLIFIGHRPVVHAVGALVNDWSRFELAKLVFLIVWVFVILQFGLQIRARSNLLHRRLASLGF